MPSKKKKYNARFPAGRIKKIMQTDEEIGKVAQAVPVIISRTLELFVDELINKTMLITTMKNARTLSPHHMKQCILSESRFDFLKDLVKSVPEVATSDDDLGSFSDNPAPAQPRQRSNSKDASKSEENITSSSTGPPTFYVESRKEPLENSHSEVNLVDDSSDSEEDAEMSENCHDTNETSKPETLNNLVIPAKKSESDSEDYDT